MHIKAIVKHQYGKDRIYVANKEQREAIKLLTNTTTLVKNKTVDHIKGLEKLGHTVEVIDPLQDIEE